MSMSSQSRPSSLEEGAAFPWLLEHVLTYPGSYEIPLRKMYTLNSCPRAQPLPQLHSSRPETPASATSSSATSSPTTPVFPLDQQNAVVCATNAHFKSSLMTHIALMPSQPISLPAAFITAFCRKVFVHELEHVDFPQSLTGLDYLRDLESRRLKDLKAALNRLGVDKHILINGTDETLKDYPGVRSWINSIEQKEKKAEALYTQVYVGIRRWAMINEMSLTPFNKANCVAMLNTLYPPHLAATPTPQLTLTMLLEQRRGFFRYIQGVSKNGPSILVNLVTQGRRIERGEENGWPGIAEVVEMYLRIANSIIEECSTISGVDDFSLETAEQMRRRKVDSGISVSSGDRPSTSSGNSSKSKEKPLPASPTLHPAKSISKLSKFARELRKVTSRNQVNEVARKEEKAKAKSVRKMKSLGALGDREMTMTKSGAQTPVFNKDEMRRERLLYEARLRKTSNTPSPPGMNFEV